LWACLFITVGFGLIGFLDDYDKVTKSSHKGVSGKVRLLAEFVVAGIGCFIILQGSGTDLYIPSSRARRRSRLVLHHLRCRRCGRRRQCGEPHRRPRRPGDDARDHRRMAFLMISYLVGRRRLRRLSRHPLCRGAGNLTVSARRSSGAGPAFLWFNAPPGRRLHGRYGQPRARRALGAIAVATQHELVLVIIGGLFVLEALSVIIQVFFYKRTGKRVFKMAPIHHHFEQMGWSEPTVVIRFWIISFVLRWPAFRR
jgi:phospho-N-acetylmuramoyl-pentapeptide-transferase